MSSNGEEQQMIFCYQQQQASGTIFPHALRFPGMNGRTIQSLNWQPQELLPCDSSEITGDSFHLLHHDNLLSKKRKADNHQDTLLSPLVVQGAKRIKGSEEKKNKVGSGDPSKDMNNNSSSEQGSAGSSSKTVKGDTTNNFKDITNKGDYIHVRARRGQATDSHSLAERVRREKISERMKYLQDLVPGCSKISGKAGMLDEIINYVQSLQRQVEFLSMKLATVNPRLDLNVHNFLGKDIQMFAPCYNNHPSETISPELSYLQFPQLQQWCDMPARPADEILQGNDLFGCSETELQSLYNNMAFSGQLLPSPAVRGADHVGVGLTNNLKMEI